MNSKCAILFFLLLSVIPLMLKAQYESSQNYQLGALYGRGWANGPAADQSSFYRQGNFHVRSNAYAFAFSFNTVGHKKGISLGPVFSMSIGASGDRSMVDDLGGNGISNLEGVWSKDMSLFIDWKIGGSLNYVIPEKQTTIGVHYFNWYQANVFGSTYGNSDDAASIGVNINYQKFGFSYSFGSKKIPGVLVNANSWNSSEFDVRYQLKYDKKTKGGVIAGLRKLTQTLQNSGTSGLTPTTKGHLLSFYVLFM